jgi:hypothetical protein
MGYHGDFLRGRGLMRAILVTLLFLIILVVSCRQRIVESGDIKSLTVSSYAQGNMTGTMNIYDAPIIAELVNRMNHSKQEPSVFIRDYEVVIAYPERKLTILVNRNRFKVNGVTYIADEDIEARLTFFLKK